MSEEEKRLVTAPRTAIDVPPEAAVPPRRAVGVQLPEPSFTKLR
jgi:hypothetical protein